MSKSNFDNASLQNESFWVKLVALILLAAVVAFFPALSWLILLIAVVALSLKLFAILAGIRWISRSGPTAFRDFRDPSNDTQIATNRPRTLIFQIFSQSDIRFPFGVNDWRWRKQIDDDITSHRNGEWLRGHLLRGLRACCFRFEPKIRANHSVTVDTFLSAEYGINVTMIADAMA